MQICDRCLREITNPNTTHEIDIDRGNCRMMGGSNGEYEWYFLCQECYDYIIKVLRREMADPHAGSRD
jgi:hypothetical protein